ncbi:hypothetical protein FA95DRAFT_443988 [Auriscalpium vulgare]|uniref:Uncharacterized protein n=1 Tax=Auriscalpium vulgare TaxID=40419 RepID=A0ACB8RG23_9AGAM|nr:hypothetical protein FA95DRAFT_443988 [Auriscalpium vulgare]
MSKDLSLPLGRDSWLTPESGAFVVFKLDPVATLEALEDPIATEQARSLSLSCRSYVGFIVLFLDLPIETRRYLRCDCLILSQGVATPIPQLYTDENMSIPIAPATHPQGRPAITAVPPLPWDNLYLHHSSCFTFRVKIDPRDIDHTDSPMISFGDLLSVQRYRREDSTRQRLRHIAAMPPRAPRRSLDCRETDACLPQASESGNCGEATGEFDPKASNIESIPEALSRALVDYEDPSDQFMPVVSFDLDIAAVSEFSGAHQLDEEIEAMMRIQAESEQRAVVALRHLDEERLAREHRLDGSSMISHPSTREPHSPIISSAGAISQPLLVRPPTSIWDKAKALTRTIFSCVHLEKDAKVGKEPETEKSHVSPSCTPVCGPLGNQIKGFHRAVCRLALRTLRRAHRGQETKAQAPPPPDTEPRRGERKLPYMFKTLRLRMNGKNHGHISLSLPSVTGQH